MAKQMDSALLMAKVAAFTGLMDRLESLSQNARKAYSAGDKRMFHQWMSAYGPAWEDAQNTFRIIGEAVVADSFKHELTLPGGPPSQVFDSLTQRFVGHTQAFQGFMASVHQQNPQFLVADSASAAKTGKSGGCYIATAVYGSYDAPEVLALRGFRDTSLSSHAWGRAFIRAYYVVSPPLAKRLEGASNANRVVRRALDFVVHRLQSVQSREAGR